MSERTKVLIGAVWEATGLPDLLSFIRRIFS
jgi:hypothetical protein